MRRGRRGKTRKSLSILLVCCLLFTIQIPAAYADDEPVNMLGNPGFEAEIVLDDPPGEFNNQNIEPWGKRGNSAVTVTEAVYDEAHSGAQSLRITNTAIASGGAIAIIRYNQLFPTEGKLPEETQYRLSFWAKSNNAVLNGQPSANNTCACVRVQFQNPGGALAKPHEAYGDFRGAVDWTYQNYVITVPAGVERLVIEPLLLAGSGQLWFDDFSLTKVVDDPGPTNEFDIASVSIQSTGVVQLTWSHDFDMGDDAVFEIHRSTENNFVPNAQTRIGLTTQNSYLDRKTREGTVYYYRIVFNNGDGTASSEQLTATVPSDLPAVQVVDSLRATASVHGANGLFWTLDTNARADSILIYGSHAAITDGSLGQLINDDADAADFAYLLDSGDDSYAYYGVKVTDADGHASPVVSAQKLDFLPRLATPVTLPNEGHPYLFANQTKIDEVRDNIPEYAWLTRVKNRLEMDANTLVASYGTTTVLPSSGTATVMSEAARTLSIAYVLTDNQAYAAAAKNILQLFVRYYETNEYMVLSQPKDDGNFVIPLAWAYDFVAKSLTLAERTSIENSYFRLVVDKINALNRSRMENQGQTNWATAVVGFLLKDQQYLLSSFEGEGYGLNYNLINGVNDDGFWWEVAPSYQDERLDRFIELAEVAHYSNFDMYGNFINGQRDMEYDGEGAPGAIEGHLTEVSGKSLKEMIDQSLNFMYSNLDRPQFGDSSSLSLSAGLTLEAGYAHYGDEAYGRYLANRFGSDRLRGGLGVAGYTSLFAAVPELPEDKSVVYGNDAFSIKGYNKLGSSLFLDTGIALLRNESDISTNLGFIWNNFGTKAGHMHPDKLGIVVNAFGIETMSDPGRYTYGTTQNTQYAQHTIAHNTLVVDEMSQAPNLNNTGQWRTDQMNNSESRSVLQGLSVGPVLRLVQAKNDNAYAHEGVVMQRTVAQIDDYIIDVYEADSDEQHTYDYPLAIAGTLNGGSVALTANPNASQALGTTMGYNNIRSLSTGNASAGSLWNTTWDFDYGRLLKTTMVGNADTQVIAGKGLTSENKYERNQLIARRTNTANTVFMNVIDPYFASAGPRTISQIDVVPDNASSPGAKDLAIQVATPDAATVDTFMTGMGDYAGSKQAGSLISDGDVAFQRAVNGEDVVLAMLNGQNVAAGDLSLELAVPGTVQLTVLGDDAYRLDYDGTVQSAVTVAAHSGFSVQKLALKDDIELSATASTTAGGKITFTAEPGSIYILASAQGFASLPAPGTVEVGKMLAGEGVEPGEIKIIAEPLTGLLIEAEDFDHQSGGSVSYSTGGALPHNAGSHTTSNPNGDRIFGWDNRGHLLGWDFEIAEAGTYRLMMNYATRVGDSVRTLNIDDGDRYQFHYPTTLGWSDRENAVLQKADGMDLTFELGAGEHTLTMNNISGALNLDYFIFERVDAPTVQPKIVKTTALIDFKSGTPSAAKWNMWAGGTIANLVSSDGVTPTGWSVTGVAGSDPTASNNGVTSVTGDAAKWIDNPDVTLWSWFINTAVGTYHEMVVSGLDNTLTYNIEVFNTGPTNNRVTEWIVNNGIPQYLSNGNPTDGQNNSETRKFIDVAPIDGKISIKYGRAEGSGYAYATAVKIDEMVEAGTPIPQQSEIDPVTANFDRNMTEQADIPVSIAFNGNTLTSINYGVLQLQEGTDYTLNGTGVVLKKSCLATLPIGPVSLEFHFSEKAPRTLVVTVTDTTGDSSGSGFQWIYEQNFDALADHRGSDPLPDNYGGFTHSRNSALHYGDDAFEITGDDPDQVHGDGGKSAVFYRESYTPSNTYMTDGILSKQMEQGYEDIFVEFYIKFQDGWTSSGDSKVFRIGNYDGSGEFYRFFADGNTGPMFLWSWSYTSYGVRNKISFRADPQETNYYMTTPGPVGLPRAMTQGDMSLNFNENLWDSNGDGIPDNVVTMIDKTSAMGMPLQPLPIGGVITHEQVYGDDWNLIQFRFKMNSAPGAMDGVIQQWINGQLAFENTQVPWQGTNSPGDRLWNTIHLGGNDYFEAYPNSEQKTEWMAIDDLRIGVGGLPDSIEEAPQSLISPVTAGFDKNTSAQANVSTLTLNGNTLTGIGNGASALVLGTDYTVAGSTVTILKGYLANQPTGAASLTFTFSGGATQTLLVSVTDSTGDTGSNGGDTGSNGRDTGGTAPSPAPSDKPTVVGKEKVSELLDKSQELENAEIEAVSPVLLVESATEEAPVQVEFDLSDAEASALPVYLYKINDDGTLTYIKSKRAGGKVVAEVTESGQYGLLSYNKTYNDVSDEFWAHSAIQDLSARQILVGNGDDSFDTNGEVTRAQFVIMLVKTLGLPARGDSEFSDVASGSWYEGYVAAAKQAGIISGMSDSLFNPDEPISREQMAVMMMRALGLAGSASAAGFSDGGDVSSWAQQAVNEAVARGLLSGYPNGEFRPRNMAKRSEGAQIIYNLIMYLEQEN